MKNRFASLIPGIVALAAIGGIVVWLTADSREDRASVTPILSRADPDLASFDAPVFPSGPAIVAASNQEPLFGEAMKYYNQRDFARASFALRQATARQPDNPEIRFFLGVSYLMTDDTRAGIRELRVAEGLGASPYVDRIHYYLAKAYLKQKDTTNAMRELNSVVESGGILADSAKKLKVELANSQFE